MMYAVIVPGYVHFKADEKVMGYTILGARTLGYVGLGMAYYSIETRDDGLLSISGDDDDDDDSDNVSLGNGLGS